MDRRLLTVLGMSVVLALVVAAIFYQVSSHASAKSPSSVMKDVVVAVEPLPLGLAVKPNHVKSIKIPSEMFPKAAFAKVDATLVHPLDPITTGRTVAALLRERATA